VRDSCGLRPEAGEELGGRVTIESKLPGLATWARVRDYRTTLMSVLSIADRWLSSVLERVTTICFRSSIPIPIALLVLASALCEVLEIAEHPARLLTQCTPDMSVPETSMPATPFSLSHWSDRGFRSLHQHLYSMAYSVSVAFLQCRRSFGRRRDRYDSITVITIEICPPT